MTHSNDVKEMLLWSHNRAWYGKDSVHGYYLKKASPPEARESFKKWAAHQDEMGEDGYNYSLEIA